MWFKTEDGGYYNSKNISRIYIEKNPTHEGAFYDIYSKHDLLEEDIVLKGFFDTEEEAGEWLYNFIMDLNGK